MDVLYGLHPVEEALKAGRRRFDHVLVARERQDDRLQRVVAQCRESGIRVRAESRDQLTAVAKTPAHQGIVALVRPQEFLSIEDLLPLTLSVPRLLGFSSRSTASKIRKISARCFAWPMEPASTASSSPSAASLR